jgi:ElaB/YqjD/DUF883 family membrane-anchored ribosome-binding protein
LVDEVEIRNVGGDGKVASEETLKLLLKAFDDMAKARGMDAKKAKDEAKKYHEELKNGIKIIREEKDAREENTEALEDATSRLRIFARSTLGLLTGSIGVVAGGLYNFAEELLIGGDRISDFAQHVPLIGNRLQTLAQVLDENIDSFRSMTEVGVDFGGSIFNLRYQAAQSGLSLETFNNVVRDNSESLALFGGSANAGARIFTQVSRIVQSQFGRQFSALGLTMEETAEYTADYLDLQRRLGRTERMDAQQLAEGTQAYILQIDRLARITGKRREQIEAELEEQRMDAVFASFLSGLDEPVRQNVQEAVAGIDQELQQGVQDMFSTGGSLASEEAQNLAQAINLAGGDIGEFQSIIRGITEGTQDETALFEYINRLGDGLDAATQESLRLVARSGGPESANLALAFLRMRETGSAAAEATNEQAEALERINIGLLDFERRIVDLRNQIFLRLIDSGIFQRLETSASKLIDYLTSPAGTAALISAVDSVVGYVERFITDVEEVGFGQALRNILTDIGDAFLDFFLGPDTIMQPGMGEVETERTGGYWQEELLPIIQNLASGLMTSIVEGISAWWGDLTLIEKLAAGITGLFVAGGPIVSAFVGGITAMFASRALINAISGLASGGPSGPGGGTGSSLTRNLSRVGRVLGRLAVPLAALGTFYELYSHNQRLMEMTPEERDEHRRSLAEDPLNNWTEDYGNADPSNTPSLEESISSITERIAEEQDRINRSMAGENVYTGPENWGRSRSENRISELLEQLESYQRQLEESQPERDTEEDTPATPPVTAPELERTMEDVSSVLRNSTETANSNTIEVLQGLNSTMEQVLTEMRQARLVDERIERNTRSMGGNIANGSVSHIR